MLANLSFSNGGSTTLTGSATSLRTFPTAGSFTVQGTLQNGATATLTVKVIAAPTFPLGTVDALEGCTRTLFVNAPAAEVTFEVPPDQARLLVNRSNPTATLAILPNSPEPFGIAARLFTGSAGPDITKPGVTLATPATGTLRSPFSVNVNFTEPVSGLALTDFTLTNGTLSALTGSGASYAITVTPGTGAGATLTLPAAAAADAAGNTSNASNTLTFTYGQNRAPSVTLGAQTVSRGLNVTVRPVAA